MNQPEETSTQFEQDLTRAMRPVDPPEGFAERVLARAQTQPVPRARILAMPARMRVWAGGAIAAVLAIGAFVGQQVHIRQERRKAEVAQQQFETALRITDETLDQVRLQLQEAGVRVQR